MMLFRSKAHHTVTLHGLLSNRYVQGQSVKPEVHILFTDELTQVKVRLIGEKIKSNKPR